MNTHGKNPGAGVFIGLRLILLDEGRDVQLQAGPQPVATVEQDTFVEDDGNFLSEGFDVSTSSSNSSPSMSGNSEAGWTRYAPMRSVGQYRLRCR